jgi:restriction system protein
MPVPDFQTLMLPVLAAVGATESIPLRALRETLAVKFALSPEDLAQLLPSGRQTTFANRVGWAASYLKQAGLLEFPSRAVYRITERGKDVLAESPERVDLEYLRRFPEFNEFRFPAETERPETSTAPSPRVTPLAEPLTPEEMMREGYQNLRRNLAVELLSRVKSMPPRAFEELVVDLLVRMGYGGSREDAGSVVGGTGDAGIDGIIKEDRLGLDTIYVQAKRWTDTVGRPELQRFAGALQGQRARKGVFLTSSQYSAEARQYAANLQSPIVLIDGPQLAELMLDHGVGVSDAVTLKILKLDEDYFAEA